MGELVNNLKSMYSEEKNTLDANKRIKDYLAENDYKHNNMVFYECKNEFNDLYQELRNNLSGEIKIMNKYINKYNTELYKINIDSQHGINEYTAVDWRNDLNKELDILQKKYDNLSGSHMRTHKKYIPTVISLLVTYDKRKEEINNKINISKNWRESHTLFQKLRMLTTSPSKKNDKNPTTDSEENKEVIEVIEKTFGKTNVKTFIMKDDLNKDTMRKSLGIQNISPSKSAIKTEVPAPLSTVKPSNTAEPSNTAGPSSTYKTAHNKSGSQVSRDVNNSNFNSYSINRKGEFSEPNIFHDIEPRYKSIVDFTSRYVEEYDKMIGCLDDENRKNLSTQPCGPNIVNKNNYNYK